MTSSAFSASGLATSSVSSLSSVLVIGAGMSGLVAARTLHNAGVKVTVIDKGRGVGGRLATRRLALSGKEGEQIEGKADHGAQYLTAHEPDFIALVEELSANGILKEWQTTSGDRPATPRYYAPDGMTAVAKYLARGIETRLAERVLRLECSEDSATNTAQTEAKHGWTAHTDKDAALDADAIIITSPVPQTMMLLETLDAAQLSAFLPDAARTLLENIEYSAALVLMLALRESPRFLGQPLAPNGGIRLDSKHVWWLADNQRKGISPNVPTLTLHVTSEASRDHWETREEELIPLLLRDVGDYIGMQEIAAHSLHRWRYSRVQKPFPEPYYRLESDVPCFLAGDAFSRSQWLPTRAEDAALSGLAAARALLQERG